MNRFLAVCTVVAAISFATIGCGDSGPKNVMDSADDAALQSYEEMIAAENAAMDADSGDVGDE